MQRRFLNILTLASLGYALLVPSTSTFAAGTWKIVWQDQFNGAVGSRPNPANWNYDLGNNGGWGNNETETYTKLAANAHVVADPKASDGKALAITVLKDKKGQYTSARILTLGKHAWTYGRFEMRAKIPAGQGLTPAFWLVGANITSKGIGWPACGEIDILESIEQNMMHVWSVARGPGFDAVDNGFKKTVHLPRGKTFDGGYHRYSVEWTPSYIKFYADGYLYNTLKKSQLQDGKKWVFDHPFCIITNLAVGGTGAGYPNNAEKFPKSMLIDYVRVYQLSK